MGGKTVKKQAVNLSQISHTWHRWICHSLLINKPPELSQFTEIHLNMLGKPVFFQTSTYTNFLVNGSLLPFSLVPAQSSVHQTNCRFIRNKMSYIASP